MRHQIADRAWLAARLMAAEGPSRQQASDWAHAASDSLTQVWIASADGAVLSAPFGGSVLDSGSLRIARKAAARRRPVVEISAIGPTKAYITAIAPIVSRNGGTLRLLIQRYDAQRSAALPFLMGGAPSARITLVAVDDDALLTSLTREQPNWLIVSWWSSLRERSQGIGWES